jgi:transformation/transcription domain-associated protein
MRTVLQKQDDCQHETLNSAPADMEGELLINMVTRAVTAIMSRLNTLSNSDVPESKVSSYHLLNKTFSAV